MQATHELIMLGTVKINKPGTRVLDRETGEYVETPGPLVYEGKAATQEVTRTDGSPTVAGGQDVTTRTYTIKVPVTVVGVAVDDVITVATDPDPALIGKRLTVTMTGGQTFATARRLIATDNLG
ncbi:DUF6093 family protein [Propionibacteriaceae bacterium Y1700]|uniref:DUF6093 family protein n=1 Tax=Microlunatus sp. Y1700 TaxID=3418487 RepID=UPI003DA7630F